MSKEKYSLVKKIIQIEYIVYIIVIVTLFVFKLYYIGLLISLFLLFIKTTILIFVLKYEKEGTKILEP